MPDAKPSPDLPPPIETPAPAPAARKSRAKSAAKKTSKPAEKRASAKETRGRPSHQPTMKERAQVKMLAAMNIGRADMAVFLGVSVGTIDKYFSNEIKMGQIEANAKVSASLYRAATDPKKPNVVAAIFWLKARAGWRENDGLPLRPPAPQLPGPKPPELGKKDAANLAAQTAHLGSDWEDLLGTPGAPPLQ